MEFVCNLNELLSIILFFHFFSRTTGILSKSRTIYKIHTYLLQKNVSNTSLTDKETQMMTLYVY